MDQEWKYVAGFFNQQYHMFKNVILDTKDKLSLNIEVYTKKGGSKLTQDHQVI